MHKRTKTILWSLTAVFVVGCTVTLPATKIRGSYVLLDEPGRPRHPFEMTIDEVSPVDAGVAPVADVGIRDAAAPDAPPTPPTPDAGVWPDAAPFDSGPLPPTTSVGVYEEPCCAGTGYVPPGRTIAPVSIPKPTWAQSQRDTAFGSTVRSFPAGCYPVYSQLQPFSHTNRYAIGICGGRYTILDFQTGEKGAQLMGDAARFLPGTETVIEYMADPSHPLELWTIQAATGVRTKHWTTPFKFVSGSRSYEELNRYLGNLQTVGGQLMAMYLTDRGDGQRAIASTDIVQKKVYWSKTVQELGCARDPQWGWLEPDWVGISPMGRYLVVQWARDGGSVQCSGLELYTIETGTFVRRIHEHHAHSDLGVDVSGREFAMSFSSAHPANSNFPSNTAYWLDVPYPGNMKHLRMVGWGRQHHVSCQGPPGVCLVSAGLDYQAQSPPLHGELYLQYLDGSVRRLVHHRSNSCDYWAQPKPSWSANGKRVAWSSDWGGACTGVSGYFLDLN